MMFPTLLSMVLISCRGHSEQCCQGYCCAVSCSCAHAFPRAGVTQDGHHSDSISRRPGRATAAFPMGSQSPVVQGPHFKNADMGRVRKALCEEPGIQF